MEKVRVLDKSVLNNDGKVKEVNVDYLFLLWKHDGLSALTYYEKCNPTSMVTKDTRLCLISYNSPYYAIDEVLPNINGYVKALGFGTMFDCGTNIFIGKGMKKATRIDLDGTKYGTSNAVLVVNQNLFKSSKNIMSAFNHNLLRNKSYTNSNGRYVTFAYLLDGIANYLYDVYLMPKLKGKRRSSIPFEVISREDFSEFFVYMYWISVINKGAGMASKYREINSKVLGFIKNVSNI